MAVPRLTGSRKIGVAVAGVQDAKTARAPANVVTDLIGLAPTKDGLVGGLFARRASLVNLRY